MWFSFRTTILPCTSIFYKLLTVVGEKKDSGKSWMFLLLFQSDWFHFLRKVKSRRTPFTWNIKCAIVSAMSWSKMEYLDFVSHPVFCPLLGQWSCSPASTDSLAKLAEGSWRDIHHITAFSLPSSSPFQQYMWKPPKQTPRKEIKIKLILSKDK